MAAQLASAAEDCAAVGDRAGAIAKYEAAMELDPSNKRFAMSLESLKQADSSLDTLFEQIAVNKATQYTQKAPPPDAKSPELEEVPEALCRCSERGDVSGLKGLVSTGADVNAPNPLRYGDTALHFAKDAKTARCLVDSGATVDAGKPSRAPAWNFVVTSS